MQTKKAAKEERVAANKRIAWFKRVSHLAGFSYGRFAREEATRIAYESGVTAEDYAAELARQSVVGIAVHALKLDAIAAARKEAEAVIERVMADLEKHGMDLELAAPYGDSFRDGREQYRAKVAKHNLYASLTRGTKASRSMRDPDIRVRSQEGIDRFIDMSEKDAALQYDAFICKMVNKIGDGAVSAELEGNHVWGYSHLFVTMDDGTVQKWRTQQITNYSVYGRPYPQWPSRIVK